MLEKGIVLLALYKPYTLSAESIISILVMLGLLWLRLSDTYRKFKPEYAKERADNSKLETF